MKALKLIIIRAFTFAPYWLQDLAVTLYNVKQYSVRHSGSYRKMRAYYSAWEIADHNAVSKECNRRLRSFLDYVSDNSSYYSNYKQCELSDFPVLEKIDLINNLEEISTLQERNAIVSLTGGTTGASMKVYYSREDMRDRFALLDHFRSEYGYSLGAKAAWFSGKSLASQRDVERGRCYRDDLINNIRFFSTFHINSRNFDHYWIALEKFKPRFMIGFPSSIYDIALLAKERGLTASYNVEAVFPTAETVLPVHREVIGSVFNTRLVDQYASSEGAPFILECSRGMMHLQPLSGFFEVIDLEGNPALEGEMLVTSFTTHGTPLVRYRIGDRIKLSDPGARCECGSFFPMVDWIDGRTSDFIWSPENGRINLGNLSNSTKDVAGIQCFQVIQNDLNRIEVSVVGGPEFNAEQEQLFLEALRTRTGAGMTICLRKVDEIPRERSGKFRIVKNSIAGTVLA